MNPKTSGKRDIKGWLEEVTVWGNHAARFAQEAHVLAMKAKRLLEQKTAIVILFPSPLDEEWQTVLSQVLHWVTTTVSDYVSSPCFRAGVWVPANRYGRLSLIQDSAAPWDPNQLIALAQGPAPQYVVGNIDSLLYRVFERLGDLAEGCTILWPHYSYCEEGLVVVVGPTTDLKLNVGDPWHWTSEKRGHIAKVVVTNNQDHPLKREGQTVRTVVVDNDPANDEIDIMEGVCDAVASLPTHQAVLELRRSRHTLQMNLASLAQGHLLD